MPNLTLADIFDIKATNLPANFDIVWCFYPYDKDEKDPGPVARPCIVRQVQVKETIIQGSFHPVGFVNVIYGTKQIDKFVPPQGFHVDNEKEKADCGLSEDTVFDLLDNITLPWSPIYFSTKNGTPVSGALTVEMRGRLTEQASKLPRAKTA